MYIIQCFYWQMKAKNYVISPKFTFSHCISIKLLSNSKWIHKRQALVDSLIYPTKLQSLNYACCSVWVQVTDLSSSLTPFCKRSSGLVAMEKMACKVVTAVSAQFSTSSLCSNCKTSPCSKRSQAGSKWVLTTSFTESEGNRYDLFYWL